MLHLVTCRNLAGVGIATGYRLGGRGSNPGSGKIFLFFTGSRRHTQQVPGALSPGVKRPGREADYSPPSSAEVKNGGAVPPLLHMSSWHNA
jgi:hypothetical protein